MTQPFDYEDCKFYVERLRGRHLTSGPWWSTLARFVSLFDEVTRLRAALEERGTYCAFCGQKYPLDNDAAELVSKHIKECKKHPMYLLQQENEKLRAMIVPKNSMAGKRHG